MKTTRIDARTRPVQQGPPRPLGYGGFFLWAMRAVGSNRNLGDYQYRATRPRHCPPFTFNDMCSPPYRVNRILIKTRCRVESGTDGTASRRIELDSLREGSGCARARALPNFTFNDCTRGGIETLQYHGGRKRLIALLGHARKGQDGLGNSPNQVKDQSMFWKSPWNSHCPARAEEHAGIESCRVQSPFYLYREKG